MQQVLFHVPLLGLPIYGYGFMLFLAFVACSWLAIRHARRIGVPKEPIQDLTVWLFFFGILGARLTFIFRYWDQFTYLGQYFAVWDGGLIFYGSIPGALLGYALAYRFQLRQYGVSHWQMADVVAPCLALGLCLGRVGCLLNGCCYGNVSCGSCPAISFPLSSPPRYEMGRRGYQTPAGFLTYPGTTTVQGVEPLRGDGVQPGDRIQEINGKPIGSFADMEVVLGPEWPRGERWLQLGVTRDGQDVALEPYAPCTIGLHPTQIYESISMGLLLFLLLSYQAYKTRDGTLMVLFMFGYSMHRFLNEMLRTDTEIVALGMTLSQNISVAVFIAAAILAMIVWRRPPIGTPTSIATPVDESLIHGAV